jgi:hypothetical protein
MFKVLDEVIVPNLVLLSAFGVFSIIWKGRVTKSEMCHLCFNSYSVNYPLLLSPWKRIEERSQDTEVFFYLMR